MGLFAARCYGVLWGFLKAAVQAQGTFALILFSTIVFLVNSNGNASGLSEVLRQLHSKHGNYTVRGKMRDGTGCEVIVSTAAARFQIEIYDNQPLEPLETLWITPTQRLVGFQITDGAEPRTILSLRDRVPYPDGSSRFVDLSVTIDEDLLGHVAVSYEDRIKHRHYFCGGTKAR